MAKTDIKDVTITSKSGSINKYSITRFGVEDGMMLSMRVNDLIIPMMSAQEDIEKQSKLFVTGLTGLPVADRLQLIKDLLTVVMYKEKSVVSIFESHFINNFDIAFQLCKEVINHNGFLEQTADIVQMFLPVVQEPAKE